MRRWMRAWRVLPARAATAGPRPVLLRVNHAGGHGGGPRAQAAQEEAGFHAFLSWRADAKGFQR